MEILPNVLLGLGVAFQPVNLGLCFLGVLLGTAVGVLPGLGPVAAISLLFPVTFQMTPVGAIILLAGIYYGAMYGGSTTSILVNIPGETASIVTCLDGYQMARQGRAGAALGMAAFGSFIAGTLGIVGLMFLAPLLGRAAVRIGPPEYVALMILGLTLVTSLSRGSVLKALVMAVAGLLVGTIGADPIAGIPRFTFGSITLSDGVGIVPVAMGMFGIAEILDNLDRSGGHAVYQTAIKGLLPTLADWSRSIGAIARGAVVGFFVGLLPGPSATIAAFSSYAMEKRMAREPERFGRGAIEGVAGPEAANNAASAGAFIPLLSLGIPANIVMAVLMGALMIHGVQPGPLFISQNPELFWGVVTSMYIGNVMLLVLNLPLIGLWVAVLRVPYGVLFPLILLFCLIGVYSLNNNPTEILVMLIFGLAGYLLRRRGFDGAPFVLALVLGPVLENNVRQSLIISKGDLSLFLSRPLSLLLLGAALVVLAAPAVPGLRRQWRRLPAQA